MQEIMTCQNCLIGWMESAARNFTYPLGMKTALYKNGRKWRNPLSSVFL